MLTSVLSGSLLAERYGSGAPQALALHGWGRGRLDWNAALAGVDALSLDLPGFGVTAPPETPWGSPEYAAALLPLVRELGRPVLVGHSFGGRVALHLAALAPEHVAGLVLTGAPLVRLGQRRKPARGYRTVRALHRLHLVSDRRMDAAREKYGSADYRATQGVMRQVFVKVVNEDYGAQLDAVAAAGIPVRLVWGELDTEVPVAVAEALRARLPQAALTVVTGSGHLLDPRLSAELRTAVTDMVVGEERLAR